MTTTIKDVAKKANVSSTTVSRILKNDPTLSVNSETRTRVISVAEKLNYIMHSPNQSERKGNIMVTNWYTKELSMTDLYFRSIRWNVETSLKANGFTVEHNFFNEKLPISSKLDGIIAIGSFAEEDLMKLKDLNKPLVVVNEDTLKWGINCVVPDYKNSVAEILDYLCQKGNVGMIAGKANNNREPKDPRTILYEQYMRKHNMYDENLIYEGDFSVQSGYENMKLAISKLKDRLPSSFFVASDTMAIGAIKALNESDISVPNQISVVGFGNLEVGRYIIPSLSTVSIPTNQMGQISVNLLINMINGIFTAPQKISVKNKLIIRKSSF